MQQRGSPTLIRFDRSWMQGWLPTAGTQSVREAKPVVLAAGLQGRPGLKKCVVKMTDHVFLYRPDVKGGCNGSVGRKIMIRLTG